jgi:hypothetical protein
MMFLFILFLITVRASSPYIFGPEDASILPKDSEELEKIRSLKSGLNEDLEKMKERGLTDVELDRFKAYLVTLGNKLIALAKTQNISDLDLLFTSVILMQTHLPIQFIQRLPKEGDFFVLFTLKFFDLFSHYLMPLPDRPILMKSIREFFKGQLMDGLDSKDELEIYLTIILYIFTRLPSELTFNILFKDDKIPSPFTEKQWNERIPDYPSFCSMIMKSSVEVLRITLNKGFAENSKDNPKFIWFKENFGHLMKIAMEGIKKRDWYSDDINSSLLLNFVPLHTVISESTLFDDQDIGLSNPPRITEPEPMPKPEPKSGTEPESEPELESKSESESESKPVSEPLPELRPESETRPEPEPESNLVSEPKLVSEPESNLISEPAQELRTEPESEFRPEARSKPEAETKPVTGPVPEPNPELESIPEPVPKLRSIPVPHGPVSIGQKIDVDFIKKIMIITSLVLVGSLLSAVAFLVWFMRTRRKQNVTYPN